MDRGILEITKSCSSRSSYIRSDSNNKKKTASTSVITVIIKATTTPTFTSYVREFLRRHAWQLFGIMQWVDTVDSVVRRVTHEETEIHWSSLDFIHGPENARCDDFTEESETVLLLGSMLNYGRSRRRMYLGHREFWVFETAQLADDSLVSTRAADEHSLTSVKGTARLVNVDTPRSACRAIFFSGPQFTRMEMAVTVWVDACVMTNLVVALAKFSCLLAFNGVSELITSPVVGSLQWSNRLVRSGCEGGLMDYNLAFAEKCHTCWGKLHSGSHEKDFLIGEDPWGLVGVLVPSGNGRFARW